MQIDWRAQALQKEEETLAVAEEDYPDLITLNPLDELLKPRKIDSTVKITASLGRHVKLTAHRRSYKTLWYNSFEWNTSTKLKRKKVDSSISRNIWPMI